MNKYLATDLDGTLLYPKVKENYICKENFDIINKYFKNNTIIVSGRNSKFVSAICDELGINQTFIACNGASIYLNGKQIYTSYLDNKVLQEIIEYVKNTYKEYCFVFFDNFDNLYSLSESIKRIEEIQNHAFKTYPKLAYDTIKDSKIINNLLNKENTFIKVNIALNDKDKEKLYNYLIRKKYCLSYSLCNSSIEITSLNTTKGNSLKRLTKIMNIEDKDVMVIGDDKNDLSMFKEYENSFLVSNKDNLDIHNITKYVINKFSDIINHLKED